MGLVTSPAFSRKATPSPLRRISQTVLAVGAVLSAAATFGPTWVVRSGIALAVIAGVVACIYAWREVSQSRRDQAEKQLADTKAHGAALTEERRHNASVVQTLTTRTVVAKAEIEKQRIGIAELQSNVSTLKGDKVHLQAKIKLRESTISTLHESVRTREAELLALLDDEDAEVHAMPRRVLADHPGEAESDEELWDDANHPTVVDMKTLATAMVMPNYEEERKQA